MDPVVDPVKWARVLLKAHKQQLRDGRAPSVLRSLVASSWQRAAESGVDPDGVAPSIFDAKQTTRALSHHPVWPLLPTVERALREATEDGRYFVALSDAAGVLLWVDGHPKALDIAVRSGFLPGHLCSEEAVGTNAVGTSLELGHPVQIFSAEHFNRRLHSLTCSAAPIRDPESRRTIGSLDLSGDFRTGHPHSLSLVSAVVLLIEGMLAEELARRDDLLKALYIDLIAERDYGRSAVVTRSGRVLAASPRGWLGSRVKVSRDGRLQLPDGVEVSDEQIGGESDASLVRTVRRRAPRGVPSIVVEPLDRRHTRVSIGEWSIDLTGRHSEILLLLVLHPDGLSGEELRASLYGPGCKTVTVRAEVSRLRRLLGPMLASNPYRLEARVEADREEIERVCRG